MGMKENNEIIYGFYFSNSELEPHGLLDENEDYDKQEAFHELVDKVIYKILGRASTYVYGCDTVLGEGMNGFIVGFELEDYPISANLLKKPYGVYPIDENPDDKIKKLITTKQIEEMNEVFETDKKPIVCFCKNFG